MVWKRGRHAYERTLNLSLTCAIFRYLGKIGGREFAGCGAADPTHAT